MAVLQIIGTNDKLTKAKVSFTVDITFVIFFLYIDLILFGSNIFNSWSKCWHRLST